MPDVRRAMRWADFRRRVEHDPEAVHRHRAQGWEYLPVHPLGDEPEHLARPGILPEDCWGVDAWWGVDGDATLLEASVARVMQWRPGLYARRTEHEEGWIYLRVVFPLPFITRTAFEAVMAQFVALGFPTGERFQLRPEQKSVWLAEVQEVSNRSVQDRLA
jgi:hypothetical protein